MPQGTDSRCKELLRQSEHLHSKRMPLLSLWQEIADNFYPQRADFTTQRSIGREFADHLTTSYPLLVQRDLSDMLSAMLRPRSEQWFHVGVSREERLTNAGRAWLEFATKTQKNAMYDDVAQFTKATKQGDGDFSAFGQCVLSSKLNRNRDALIYRNWHLRDVAWAEDENSKICTVDRKWKPTVLDLYRTFGEDKLHEKVKELRDKDPYATVNCRHVVMPADNYHTGSGDGSRGKWTMEYVSIYYDADNGHIMEELPINYMEYTIPRWQTVSGSQYAYSPCTVAGLPDARLIQAMSLTLLEAGEKAVNPPVIATQDVVRSDISYYAGGVTWVDRDYDERLGDAMRPMPNDSSAIPFGMEMRADVKQTLMEAFYLNKINLPSPQGGDMTAFEVSQRVQEYIRGALPLFEPMEVEYNNDICSKSFEVLMSGGAFGSVYDMPQELRGQDIKFSFESPLHEAIEKQKGQTFMETKAMLAEAVALDPSSTNLLDAREALRDVLNGIGTPAKWMRSEADIEAKDRAQAQEQQAQQMLQNMQAGGQVAEQAGRAAQALQGAQN